MDDVPAENMTFQPRATGVREGGQNTEAQKFRGGLLLVNAEDQIVSATQGLLAFLSRGAVSQAPSPAAILPSTLWELIRQARRTRQALHSFPVLWQPEGEPETRAPLEVDLLLMPRSPSPAAPMDVALSIRCVPGPAFERQHSTGVLVLERPELLTEVAHEIKNSLVAIKTFVELLLEKDPTLELGRVVRNEVDRISGSVGRLLGASAPQLEFESIGLHELILPLVQIVRSQAGTRSIRLDVELNARNAVIRAQPRQLEQAFLNLMMNGLEAMGDHGQLTVRTENQDLALDEKAGAIRCVVVTVSDTGCGIPPQNLERLFDEFYTTKRAGTGLGLPIARRIVLAHGGRVDVESEVGKGSVFRFIFPLA